MTNFLRGIVLKALYPAMMLVGAFFKSQRERLQICVIEINNRLVITHNISNCKRCGKCEIKDLIKISEENNLRLFVATGGTIARRIVKETRPEAIIAVACERDLSSGLVDTYPLPVLGILNERPFGPCVNTRVDLAKVEDAITFFAGAK